MTLTQWRHTLGRARPRGGGHPWPVLPAYMYQEWWIGSMLEPNRKDMIPYDCCVYPSGAADGWRMTNQPLRLYREGA